MKPVSPMGRYSAIVATIVILGIVVAFLYSHTFGTPDNLIDNAFILVLGIITGTAGSLTVLNGTVKRTDEQDTELISLRKMVADLHDKMDKNNVP